MPESSALQMNVIHALRELTIAMDTVIAVLEIDRARTASTLLELEQGETSIVEVAQAQNMAEVRERLTGALQQFDQARGNARVQIFRALQGEGQSMGQIAKLWGISRQLVSRLIGEHATDEITE